ncbi:MAG: hypothetical protein K2Y29_07965, partial [Beijerinckiaceae bacterium]|nr:hypothetical protein [Beijerinckiaceae bacterium]
PVMYVRIIDGEPVAYNLTALRRDNPQVSFPAEMPAERLAEYDVYGVAATKPPSVADDEHAVAALPALVNGVWTQQWAIEPKPVYVPQSISDRQFFHALAKQGKINQDEALAAVMTGTIPATMMAIVDAIPDAAEKFDAKMFLAGAVVFDRGHPLVGVFANAMGMSEGDVDALFTYAAGL